ncbi:UDP-2,3-diacylglucosamine diphosphatase [Pantoea sp. Aalb]|uniref:UDP-2,3-diacylglucosamine diphosphatase n=1 Tax=Pantoea sp. Aalb TaxID=2576762 RepID=UPI001320993C|nr:UDP-2,3-diacylglucosamine diphosphatase [Pantoea sp. Aalb]MXP67563.1 UDP-2,3-diacylglucosamine diphosphatase [Pantoea sp. Aalb]
MSSTLFISDLHLCGKKPKIITAFINFLQSKAQQYEAIYLLGDLFEIWIGDDDPNPLYKQVANTLKALPIPKFFIHGNRDFLIGQCFANASGIILLPKEHVLTLYGHSILIMHGDTLCIDDGSYQLLRIAVHQRWIQRLFLILPIYLRIKLAAQIRSDSNQGIKNKSLNIMDVNQQAVENIMTSKQVNILIHGHTHRPAIHKFKINGKIFQRIVLGSWDIHASMVQIDSKGISFIEFQV